MSNNVPGTDFISLHFGTCFAQHSGKKSIAEIPQAASRVETGASSNHENICGRLPGRIEQCFFDRAGSDGHGSVGAQSALEFGEALPRLLLFFRWRSVFGNRAAGLNCMNQ